MKVPELPNNEEKRLEALKSYNLLDTLPEDAYDNITQLASYICDTPISLVTLLDADRNFLKSRRGVDITESPRDISFCGHAILTEDPVFVVEDARLDERFQDNPLVKEFKAIFYAGVPLRTSNGYSLGTLCVYDHEPRTLTQEQKTSLINLSKQVILLFEARKQNHELERSKKELKKRGKKLEDFSGLVAHDLKSPLASIEGIVNLIKEDYPEDTEGDLTEYVSYLEKSVKSMRNYIDGLLNYYKAENLLETKETISLKAITDNISDIFLSNDVSIKINDDFTFLNIPAIAIQQILSNLIDNAVKYNDKEETIIELNASGNEDSYVISVEDNGSGIAEENIDLIFNIFKTTGKKDKFGNKGTGMGLATVKKLVENLGGTITLDSKVGKGSNFTFTFKR